MKKENFLWNAVKIGLLGGVITIFICLVGMTEIFSKRYVIEKVVTLGQFVLLTTIVGVGFIASRRTSNSLGENRPLNNLTAGVVAGLVTGLVLALFVFIGYKVNLRAVFLNASPPLYNLLTFGKGQGNIWPLPLIGAAGGLIGAAFLLIPATYRGPLTRASIFTFFMALFSGLFRVVMINQKGGVEKAAKYLFGQTGLTWEGTLIFFLGVLIIALLWNYRNKEVRARISRLPKRGQLAYRRPLRVH